MLHTHTDDGDIGWTCPGCKKENTAHVSHPQVEHPYFTKTEVVQLNEQLDDMGMSHLHIVTKQGEPFIHTGMIALPPCECGTRTSLNASFTDEDLSARNMLEPIFDEDEFEPKIIGYKPTESHAAAHRHMALAKQMQALGKHQTSAPGHA